MSTLREKMLAIVKKTCTECDRVAESCLYCSDIVDRCLESIREALPPAYDDDISSANVGREEVKRMIGWNSCRTAVLKLLEGK